MAPVRADPGALLEGLLFGPHGLRAGWRIALWLLLATGILLVSVVLGRVAGLRGDFAAFGAMLLASLLSGFFVLHALDDRAPGALGFALDPAAVRDSWWGFVFGAVALGAGVALMALTGAARWEADGGGFAQYLAVLSGQLAFFLLAAAAEEAAFRGYGFQALVQGIGPWPATVVSSLLFAWAHRGNDNASWMGLLNIFLGGVMLAVLYLRTRSLWAATTAHAAWNWMMSALLDFPVSGRRFDTPLYSARETGADWWTGGLFGPEAGLATTLAVVAAIAWLLRTPALRESPRMRALRPLVDARIGERWPVEGSGIRG